jgi:hypothetical protein
MHISDYWQGFLTCFVVMELLSFVSRRITAFCKTHRLVRR